MLVAQCGGAGNLERIHRRCDQLVRSPEFAGDFTEWTEPWEFADAGTTGARSNLSPALAGLVTRARRIAEGVPLYAGFGISTPAQARAAGELADGVVVGSRAVEAADDGPDALREYVGSLRSALDA